MSIDRYDPIRVLGEGSFGKVYLMRDKIKRNFVCVKIIKIKNIPKKEREATKMEVDLLRRLHHPNIVGYIDSFLSKNGESLCICMEYCDGGDLASQIKAAKRNLFSESKILHWFVQLALGLHYMHTNKVLHRDLKTQNIFMLGNGRLVLGDLGISKVLDGTMDFAQTCIGTPYYMSPEIFQNKPYSYKSDVWALGCVLYEMTTLNHAFDANSLNGLATKIVKGKYPPIHAKYSRYLRELIAQMLMINPQQRPDLDQILRKPFIKKHVVNFFVDIASRPSTSIGEGTMVFKAAAGGPTNGNSYNDSNMISLRQQLTSLDMSDAIGEAMKPKNSAPQDDEEAIRLAKEQAGALKREQEHKKMVEAALEKLRQERENRSKQRNDNVKGVNPARYMPNNAAKNDPRKAPQVPIPAPQVTPSRNVPGPSVAAEVPKRDVGVRDRGINWMKKPEEEASNAGGPVRRRSYGEDKERIIEREKKAAEDRRRLIQQEQEAAAARAKAEDKRREEVRAEARAREEARLREEAKLREEQAERLRMEQVREKAEQVAKAKREAQREKERERQRLEIEQLKRDKIELDRRANERARVRDERRADERGRVDNLRKDQLDVMQSKLDYMNDQLQKLEVPKYKAEEKIDDQLSARERVYQRRQEKQAREEAERLEVLREAEAENRRIRTNAQQEFRNKVYGDNSSAPTNPNPSYRPTGIQENDDNITPRYEFDNQGRSKAKNRMDLDELSDRLEEATRGKGNRYEEPTKGSRVESKGGPNNGLQIDYPSDSGSEEEIWDAQDNSNALEVEEDLHRREEELKAELNFATLRVEELKKTLQETKSFLGPRLPTRGKTAAAPAPKEESYDEEDEDLYEFEEEDDEEIYEESSKYGQRPSAAPAGEYDIGDSTLRRVRPPESAVPSSAYGALQDQPSPSGKLSDRIERLRQRCIEALGRDAFFDAYNFLKLHEFESQGYDNGRGLDDDDYEAKKIAKIRSILGEGKAHYMSLIDQLIFMEGAERD